MLTQIFITPLQYSSRFIVVVKVLIFQLLDALSDRQTLDCLTYLTRAADLRLELAFPALRE